MTSFSPTAGVANTGRLFALFLDVARLTFKRPFQLREFIQQGWFLAGVTILPTALVAIPFGAVIALQLGGLTRQLGAQSFTGAASVLAILREASPIVCALLIAGAGGSAICADIGSRKIRDEIDAMEVPRRASTPSRSRSRCSWSTAGGWSRSSSSWATTRDLRLTRRRPAGIHTALRLDGKRRAGAPFSSQRATPQAGHRELVGAPGRWAPPDLQGDGGAAPHRQGDRA